MLHPGKTWIVGWQDENGVPVFEWEGGDIVARVTGELLDRAGVKERRAGRPFWLGSMHLVIVSSDFVTRTYEVTWAGSFSALLYSWRKVQHLALLTYCRLIRTAEVWNLARVPDGTVPSYRDLNVVRSLLRIKARDEGKVIE